MNPSKHNLTIALFSKLNATSTQFNNLDELFKTIWKNTSQNSSWALTNSGVDHLVNQLELEHWEFVVPDIVSADILMMQRYMTSPYQLVLNKSKNHKNLILFDESTATQLILYNNDLKLFLAAHDSSSNNPVTKRKK